MWIDVSRECRGHLCEYQGHLGEFQCHLSTNVKVISRRMSRSSLDEYQGHLSECQVKIIPTSELPCILEIPALFDLLF